MTVALLPAHFRALLENHLPEAIEPLWWSSRDELAALAPRAQIGWFDLTGSFDKAPILNAIETAPRLEWLNTAIVGVDWLPLDVLHRRNIRLTNGSGTTATTVAEFAVLGMLAIARDYRSIVRAQDRHEWPRPAGAMVRELSGSRALLLGFGAIGRQIGQILTGFGVECVAVRRNPDGNALGPDDWRHQIGTFDWVILSLPATDETKNMIGAAELAAMRADAVFVNVGRGECVDQPALVAALREKRIAAALLDPTDPEPLPPDHELWTLDNAHITMHRAGLPSDASRKRAAERFITNCGHYLRGQRLLSEVDLLRGY